mgnify:CR=1 FL=1
MMISLLAILFSCQQMEPAAPTMIDELTAYPGIGRVRLEFTPTEGAVAGKVYYNSGSVQKFWIEDGTRLQSVEVTGLPAGENTLRVVMMDAHGRESLPKGVVVEVYGESYYAGTLSNRTFIKMQDAGDDAIEITFDKGKTIGYLAQHQDLSSHRTVYEEIRSAREHIFAMEREIRRLEQEMKHAADLAVTLEVDVQEGKDWYEAH